MCIFRLNLFISFPKLNIFDISLVIFATDTDYGMTVTISYYKHAGPWSLFVWKQNDTFIPSSVEYLHSKDYFWWKVINLG